MNYFRDGIAGFLLSAGVMMNGCGNKAPDKVSMHDTFLNGSTNVMSDLEDMLGFGQFKVLYMANTNTEETIAAMDFYNHLIDEERTDYLPGKLWNVSLYQGPSDLNHLAGSHVIIGTPNENLLVNETLRFIGSANPRTRHVGYIIGAHSPSGEQIVLVTGADWQGVQLGAIALTQYSPTTKLSFNGSLIKVAGTPINPVISIEK